MNKSFTVVIWLVCLLVTAFAHDAEATDSFDPNKVEIAIQHAIELPWKAPGFRISISRWIPEEALSIKAISPDGEEVDLVPIASPLHADADGNMIVDIDYQRKGLAQGHWVLLISGQKAGIHMIQTDLPSVEPPSKANPNWTLTF